MLPRLRSGVLPTALPPSRRAKAETGVDRGWTVRRSSGMRIHWTPSKPARTNNDDSTRLNIVEEDGDEKERERKRREEGGPSRRWRLGWEVQVILIGLSIAGLMVSLMDSVASMTLVGSITPNRWQLLLYMPAFNPSLFKARGFEFQKL